MRPQEGGNIDRKTLNAQCADGRISFRALGQLVYLSPNAAAERVRRLRLADIIRGIYGLLDSRSLGLCVEAYIDVKLQARTSTQQFEAAAMKLPGVVSIAIMTGPFDGRLRVACKDQAELHGLIEALRAQGRRQGNEHHHNSSGG